ncbi:hypothetical protein [Nocardia sp. SC052]|uniref:hypothetical protein n=1 Tax=Nocardia sichangensis TaxID=3385975 RepID=UPI0039A180D4
MAHITAIRNLLDVLAATDGTSVAVWQRQIPAWTHYVLNYPSSWASNAPAFDPHVLDHLETLSGHLRRIVPPVPEATLEQLRETLNDLLKLLGDDTTIPAHLRAYLATLANHMRTVLDEYRIRGDYEVRMAVEILFATVSRAANASQSEGETRQRWRDMAARFVIPVVVPAAIEAASVFSQLQLGM